MTQPGPSIAQRCVAEAVGTFILVFFGTGAVHTAVLIGAQSGLWQVAIVWAIAIMLAAYVVGGISGAHINPAITIALAAWGQFARRDVVPYIMAQLAGAILASATLFTLFRPYLAAKELEKGVVRGQPGSEITAMCYGEYFPNPGSLAGGSERYSTEAHERLNALVSEPIAFFAEMLGTMILALVVFAITCSRNHAAPQSRLAPVFIGLTIAVLISVIAPLTQAGFNPARDFGPRLFAFFAGWGSIALPGPRGLSFLTVYIVAPVVGAVLGGGIFVKLLRPALTLNSGSGSGSS
jgi:glycerol uptake facilitator protein